MKLVILQHNINERGGAERVMLKIAQHYDAKIYTCGYNRSGTFEGFKDLDIEVIGKGHNVTDFLPKRVANAVRYGYNFYNLKIREDYDVINPHMSPSEWARNRNERALWYCHTPPRELYDLKDKGLRNKSVREKVMYSALSKVYKRVERRIVKKIEAIATNSEVTKDRISKYLNANAEVISPGIDVRGRINRGDGRYFLYPSRISPQKRQHYAIEAFSRFARTPLGKRYKLIIAGSLSSRYKDFAGYYDELKKMNVPNVKFILNPDDAHLRDLYSRATGILYTPINEDFGLVPLEAMASQKPIISVNEGGPRETIINGKTGFLVNSPASMAKRMEFLVEHQSITLQMGKAARRHVSSRYSWKAFFTKFDAAARKVSAM